MYMLLEKSCGIDYDSIGSIVRKKSCTWRSQKIIVIQIMNSSSAVLPVLKSMWHKVVLSKGRV